MTFTRNPGFVELELKIENVVIERKISVRVFWSYNQRKIKLVSSHSYHKNKNGQAFRNNVQNKKPLTSRNTSSDIS